MSLGTKFLVVIWLLLLVLIVHFAYLFTVTDSENNVTEKLHSAVTGNLEGLGGVHSHLFWFVQVGSISSFEN